MRIIAEFSVGSLRLMRRILGCCIALSSGIGIVETSAADVVQMSPYEVAAQSVEFRGWKKFSSPNFVVYTDARAKEIRPYIQQMEIMHVVNQVIFGRRPLKHERVRVILPTARSDWRKLRSKGGVEWKVAVSRWQQFSYTCLVEYDWQHDGLYVFWGSLGSLEGKLLGIDWSFPLQKGMSTYFETMRVMDSGVKVGTMSPRVLHLRQLGFIDWLRFFELTASSREFRKDGNDLKRLGGQSALFTHYWLMHEDKTGLGKILDWNAQIHAGTTPTSEAFAEVFGLDYESFEEVMEAYLKQDKFNLNNYGIQDEVRTFVVTELDVKATEMRELFVLIQILNQRIDESETALESLLQKGLESPELQPLLVEACLSWRQDNEARKILAGMIDEDDAAETHTTFLQLEFLKAIDGLPLAAKRLETADYHRLRTLADAALQREPLNSLSNLILGWLLALKEDIGPAELVELREICRRMDGNGDTDDPLAALALASRRMGDVSTADRLIALVDASPYTDKGVRRFIESYREEFGSE